MKRNLIWMVGCTAVFVFLWFVWPTPWVNTTDKYKGKVVTTKVNRITNSVCQYIFDEHNTSVREMDGSYSWKKKWRTVKRGRCW